MSETDKKHKNPGDMFGLSIATLTGLTLAVATVGSWAVNRSAIAKEAREKAAEQERIVFQYCGPETKSNLTLLHMEGKTMATDDDFLIVAPSSQLSPIGDKTVGLNGTFFQQNANQDSFSRRSSPKNGQVLVGVKDQCMTRQIHGSPVSFGK